MESSDVVDSPESPPSPHTQGVQRALKMQMEMQSRAIFAAKRRCVQTRPGCSSDEDEATPIKKSAISESGKALVVQHNKPHTLKLQDAKLTMSLVEDYEYIFWQKVLENGEDEALEQLCAVVETGSKPPTKWGNIAVPFKYMRRWTAERAAGRDSATINEKIFWKKVMEQQEAESRLLREKEPGKWKAIRVPCKFWHPLYEERESRRAAACMSMPLMEGAETAQKVHQSLAGEPKKKKKKHFKQDH